jgi:hypothetical protein
MKYEHCDGKTIGDHCLTRECNKESTVVGALLTVEWERLM